MGLTVAVVLSTEADTWLSPALADAERSLRLAEAPASPTPTLTSCAKATQRARTRKNARRTADLIVVITEQSVELKKL